MSNFTALKEEHREGFPKRDQSAPSAPAPRLKSALFAILAMPIGGAVAGVLIGAVGIMWALAHGADAEQAVPILTRLVIWGPLGGIALLLWWLTRDFRRYGVQRRKAIGLRESFLKPGKTLGITLTIYLIVLLVAALYIQLVTKSAEGAPVLVSQVVQPDLGPAAMAFIHLHHLIVAPALEEITFRGYLQSALARKMPAFAAILITASIFGGFHIFMLPFLPFYFLFGLALGVLFHLTKSLWPPMLLHALYNSTAVGAALLTG